MFIHIKKRTTSLISPSANFFSNEGKHFSETFGILINVFLNVTKELPYIIYIDLNID